MAVRLRPAPSATALEHNLREWQRSDYVAEYASDALEPVESRLLDLYREDLAGRVLELGCGGGRVTGHLVALGGEVHGIDISAHMVEYCTSRHPGATYRQGDMRDLSAYESGSFDAVVAACNILDALEHADRLVTLDEIARVLRPGGLLIMSAHNRHFIPRLRGPYWVLGRRPRVVARRVVSFPRRYANHRRLRHLQRFEADYAILNDSAHDFALLQYYITPDAQRRQLEDHGFDVLLALDIDARELGPGDHAANHVRVHYAARRRGA